MSNPPAIEEAIRLLRIIDKYSMGMSNDKGELWIGWQGDAAKEAENLTRDVRGYLAVFGGDSRAD